MTFTENLESAKNGNKRSYGMLCNDYADPLYAVAFLVLDTASDAEDAVKSAFEDGFKGIDRINDGNHLCAWLSRELTKYIVAKLKEYRAGNKTVSGGDIPEKTVFCRLNDLDRLVCALSLAFGYKTKEITVITGLKEETVERKLGDSDKKLGKDKEIVEACLKNIKAPDSLITKLPQVHDLTVEIDHFDDDELISEMERIAAFAQAEESKSQNHVEAPRPSPKKEKAVPGRLIKFQPARFRDEDEGKPEVTVTPEPYQSKEFPKVNFAEPGEPVVPAKPKVRTPEAEVPATPEPAAEPKPEAVMPSEPVQTEQPEEAEAPAAKKEIDAKTFINVITAQKIKGSEFLKLMGNTRISNNAYREIEQNPNLTKDRLVELLEESPLTSEDYVKILTAVKQRNEILSRKQEAQKKLEQAGLFSINKRDESREPEAPVSVPVPEPEMTDTQAFASNDFTAPEPAPVTKPAPAAENEDKPFAPRVDIETDENAEDEGFDPYATAVIAPPVAHNRPAKPEVRETSEPPVDEAPAAPDINEAFKPAEEAVQEKGKREKYKGREYFIDDDVYYPGVNNGKIIFSAACAVLLIGGSFGVRYFTTGNAFPTDNPSLVANTESEDKLPEEYLSNADIYEAVVNLEPTVTYNKVGYYRTDGRSYSEVITKDFCETGDLVYIANDDKILIYDLSAENPFISKEIPVKTDKEFLGFTADGDKAYIFYADEYTETFSYNTESTGEDGTTVTEEHTKDIKRSRVTMLCYKDAELALTYSQDGDFISVSADASSVSLATSLNTAKSAIKEAEGTYLPSYTFNDNRAALSFENITVPEGIAYSGFTLIGTVNDDEARVHGVLGGSQSDVFFEEDLCTVVLSDKNKTISETFRFVGSSLTPVSSEIYEGECYSAEFISGDGTVVTSYDSENRCVTVYKKNGGEWLTASGIAPLETLTGVSYTDKYAYIITENIEKSTMLYCVDISGDELTAAEASPDAVYTEKLRSFGDSLIGLTAEADSEGNRTGLKLSVYDYDNGLSEKRSVLITMDENTDTRYLRYLAGDAESSNLRIAVDETGTMAAVFTVYFDGISEIERILCYKDDGTELTPVTDLLLFDIRSDYRVLTFRGNTLYVITDSSVIAIDAETGAPLDYFNETASAETEEAETQTEADAVLE